MVFASSYSNFRVVAVERRWVEQRELIQEALDRGIVDGLPPGTTLYLTSRDMNWGFGNLIFYGITADHLVYLDTGLKLDVRTLGPPGPTCGPPSGFPTADCVTPSRRVALMAVRGSRGGGTVVLAGGMPADRINDTGSRTLTALARDASAAGENPSLVGTRPDGSSWSVAEENRASRSAMVGCVTRRESAVPTAPWPDRSPTRRSQIDFTAPTNTPGSLVRLFGTKRLLP
jgi:hypothetical protein